MMFLNIIVLGFLIWKYGVKKLLDFSELKKFYILAIGCLLVGNIITVLKYEAFDIEYFVSNLLLYSTFVLTLKIFEFSDKKYSDILYKISLYFVLIFTLIQVVLSFGGNYWNWDGISLIDELRSVSVFSRFFYILWFIFVTSLGVFIMQLMEHINRDREYAKSLLMVLALLVLITGLGSNGFYPRVFVWAFSGVYLGLMKNYLDLWINYSVKNRPNSVNILGLKLDNVDTEEAIEKINSFVMDKKSSLVITPYSEFFVKIQKDNSYKKALDQARLSIPDGIYVNWASLYQNMPVSSNLLIRVFQSIWLYVFTGASIVLFPRLVRAVVKARVSGSDIIYPVSKLAAKKKYTVMLYGGFDFGRGNTGVLAATKLKNMYKGLRIVNVYPGDSGRENDKEATSIINKYKPDILFMCLGTKEPEWLYKRRNKLKFGVAFAMGGTFDYVAGDAVKVDKKISESGLEWLVRPVMLVGTGGLKSAWKRFKRVWTGMLVGSFLILAWKIKFGYIEKEKK